MCCSYWWTAYEPKISLTYLQYIQFFSSCCSAVWKCEKLRATDGRWHAHFPSMCFLPLLILERKIPAKSFFVQKDCLALGSSGTILFFFFYLTDSLSASKIAEPIAQVVNVERNWFETASWKFSGLGTQNFKMNAFFKEKSCKFCFLEDAHCSPKLSVRCFIRRTVRH